MKTPSASNHSHRLLIQITETRWSQMLRNCEQNVWAEASHLREKRATHAHTPQTQSPRNLRDLLSNSCNQPAKQLGINCALNTRGLALLGDLKMITRKQCPLQPSTPLWAAPRLRPDHVSDGATPSLLQPSVCCRGIIPENPLFSSVHPTHTHTLRHNNK